MTRPTLYFLIIIYAVTVMIANHFCKPLITEIIVPRMYLRGIRGSREETSPSFVAVYIFRCHLVYFFYSLNKLSH